MLPAWSLLNKYFMLSWRMAVTVAYLGAWEARHEPMAIPEGASQRIHEDVERMTSLTIRLGTSLVSSALKLGLFVPQLYAEGSTFPLYPGAPRAGLVLLALASASVGLGGAALIGRTLVGLYVALQQVEGALRKRMALMEDLPPSQTGTLVGSSLRAVGSLSRLFGTEADAAHLRFVSKVRGGAGGHGADPTGEVTGEGGPDGHLSREEVEWVQNEARHVPGRSMMPLLALLRRLSYRRYKVEATLQCFTGLFDDFTPNIVWLVALPAIFDPLSSATPGSGTRLSGIYYQVVTSLGFLIEHWEEVNELRSVLHRLHGYEVEICISEKAFKRLVRSGPPIARTRATGHEAP
jgi:ABC-type long-subunit fatty acid transport system fused permease/ATPase subunit